MTDKRSQQNETPDDATLGVDDVAEESGNDQTLAVTPDDVPGYAAAEATLAPDADDATVAPDDDGAGPALDDGTVISASPPQADADRTLAADFDDMPEGFVPGRPSDSAGGSEPVDDQTIVQDEDDLAAGMQNTPGREAAFETLASSPENVRAPDMPFDQTIDAENEFTETVIADASADGMGTTPGQVGPGMSIGPGGKGTASSTQQDLMRYRLVNNFARGGMGNIWMANDGRLHRDIAYKELLPNAMGKKVVVERFIQEAQITGQLEHPGIVPVYDLGWQANGTPYYAMKLVRGTEMKEAIGDLHKLPKESHEFRRGMLKLLNNFIDICNALAFAHERGVLHRDLKPQNVMLGDYGETLVLDWGLAKLLGRDATQNGNVVEVSGKYSDTFNPDAVSTESASPNSETVIENTDGGSAATSTNQPTVDARGNPINNGAATTAGKHFSDATAAGDATSAGAVADSSGDAEDGATQIVSYDDAQTANLAARSQSPATQSPGGTAGPGSTQSPSLSTDGSKGLQRNTFVRTSAASVGTTTRYGTIMGTPAYMPPEQAQGRLDEMDARTDIFSLGAILYEILTNETPISRGSIKDMLDHILNKPIKPPREIDPSIPKPLDAIAMKALEKKREDRYATALLLARDVEDFLADEPVSAYAEPWQDRLYRWVRRNRTIVMSTAVGVAVVTVATVGWSVVEARRIGRLQSAIEERVTSATRLADAGDLLASRDALDEAAALAEPEPELVGFQNSIDAQIQAIASRIELAERERIANIETAVESERQRATELASSDGNLPEARTILVRAVTTLQGESALAGLLEQVQSELGKVDQQIAQQAEIAAAQQRYADFIETADRSRFYATVSLGDVRGNRQIALDGVTAAFALFGNVSAETPTLPVEFQTGGSIAHLDAVQTDDVHGVAYELLLIRADLEVQAIDGADEAAIKAATDRAIAWLDLARTTGLESQAYFLRKARYQDLAGDIARRDVTLLAAEEVRPSTALDFYLVGEEQRRSGLHAQALRSYRRSLQLDPDNFWALNQMGLSHLLSGDPAAAVASYTACLARRPDERICFLTRGIAYSELGQHEEALDDLNRAAELDPDLYAVYLNRGAVYLNRGDHALAIADFQKAATLQPESAGPHVNLGEVYRVQERFDEAERELTAALQVEPENRNAVRIRAAVRLQLNRPSDAQQDYLRLSELDPSPQNVASCWKEVGLVHHRAAEHLPALDAYDRSLAADPSDADTHRLRAEVLLAVNRDADAVDAFAEYLRRGGKPVADVFRARSLALQKLGRTRESLADIARALELEPDAANMLMRRGWALLTEANALALKDFEEAVASNPESADGWNGRGYARVMSGNYAGGTADAEEALKRARVQLEKEGPGTWPNLYNAATIYGQAINQALGDGQRTPEERDKIAAAFAVRAVQIVAETLQAGGASQQQAIVQTLLNDPAMATLRAREEFKRAFAPRQPNPQSPQPDAPQPDDGGGSKPDQN